MLLVKDNVAYRRKRPRRETFTPAGNSGDVAIFHNYVPSRIREFPSGGSISENRSSSMVLNFPGAPFRMKMKFCPLR